MGDFGARLRILRQQRGLSLMELSKYIGVSKSSVNMYERGEREPSFETIEAIADFFNVDIDYLMGRSEIPNRQRLDELSAYIDRIMTDHPENIRRRFTVALSKLDDAGWEAVAAYAQSLLDAQQSNSPPEPEAGSSASSGTPGA